MMKSFRKILFIFILITFMTGCEGEYHLDIKGSNFVEEFSAVSYDPSTWDFLEDDWSLKREFESRLNSPTAAFFGADVNSEEDSEVEGVEYYKKELTEDDDSLRLSYKYKFNKKNYSEAFSILTMFPNFTLKDDNGTITLDTGTVFAGFNNYYELERVKIIITTDRKVKSHNANLVDDNKYIWILEPDMFDEEDLMRESLQFTYQNVSAVKTNYLWTILIILLTIVILGILAIIFVRYRIHEVNK